MPSSGYNRRNRCSFGRFPKVSRDGAEVSAGKIPYASAGDATRKSRRPIVGNLTAGIVFSAHYLTFRNVSS